MRNAHNNIIQTGAIVTLLLKNRKERYSDAFLCFLSLRLRGARVIVEGGCIFSSLLSATATIL